MIGTIAYVGILALAAFTSISLWILIPAGIAVWAFL